MSQTANVVSAFEAVRGRLFGLAYRMLGSRAEAEDLVQDAYLRWHQARHEQIENPEAWLVTATTRLAIDRLRRLKTERDAYIGSWLPEPIVTETPPPDRNLDLAADLSMAFLTLLERLAPEERAAFLLHDVFDVDYGGIAQVLERSEAACRQVVHRARERVRGDRRRFEVAESAKAALLSKFMAAVEARDEPALLGLFTPDATWTADGGGKASAARTPIVGADRIARLLLTLRDKFWAAGRRIEIASINGETGLTIRDGGQLTATMSFATDGKRILAVYAVLNPDKLGLSVRHNPSARPSSLQQTEETEHECTSGPFEVPRLRHGPRDARPFGPGRIQIDKPLFELVKIRASQINGCAYCLDMHTKEARLAGETEQRIYALNAWRETPFFSDRERAALEWTETVTRIGDTHAPDEVYERVSREFPEAELVALTMAVVVINSWNRLSVSFRPPVGSYQPAVAAHAAR